METPASKIADAFVALLVAGCLLMTGCATRDPLTVAERDAVREKLHSPKICVALSGGGLRSAAFSTGVLRALAQDGALEKTDVVSATSGGGWALLWLHSRLARGLTLEDVYGDRHTTDTKELRKLEKRKFVEKYWTAGAALAAPAGTAWAAYHAKIAGKFGRSIKGTSIDDININVTSGNVPIPVITASTYPQCHINEDRLARYGIAGPPLADRLKELMPMEDHLVELTPVSWGSRNLGYSSAFPEELQDMEDRARIASAAIDAPGYRQCETLRSLGFTFGKKVTTPKSIDRNYAHEKIYLADGGFVDNLAARNLIERGCGTLLISDAEHDPTFIFEGYQRLNKDLEIIDKRIVVEDIDN